MDDELDRLYSVPLADFVAERDALAKKLRGAGERDRAAEVKALSKPSRAAAAVNRLMRDHPAHAEALAEAAGGLADAQAEVLAGGDPAALRERTEAARAAVAQLVAEMPAAESAATRGAVEDTLRAALVDPRVLADVRSGRLEKERAAAGFGGLADGPPPPKKRTTGARPDAKTAGRNVKVAGRDAKAGGRDAARRAAADREELERASAARAEREREERRRQAALRRAKEAEATAQTDLAAAERALEQVEVARRSRREDVKQATARLRDARRRREREEQRS